MDGPVSPRALIKRHKNPIEAFEAADPEGKGVLDLKTMRRVLQNLSTPASAMEMVTYGKKYGNGDGKTINYRKFLEAHQVPLSSVAQHMKDLSKGLTITKTSSSSSGPVTSDSTTSSFPLNNNHHHHPSTSSSSSSKLITSPIADKRAEKPVPGNPARPDNYRPETLKQTSRLLKFESDSHDFPHYIHGNPGIENFLPNLSMRSGRRSDYPQRELDYTNHKLAVIGSDLQEIEAAHAHEDSDIRNYSKIDGGVTTRLDEPLFTGGLICESGGIGPYINDVAGTKAISDEYLPLFPGELYPRQKSVNPIAHGGKVAQSGNIFKFMNDESWKDEHPEGYLPPLPNGLMDAPRAIVFDPINQTGSLVGSGSAGIAVWAQDTTENDNKFQRLRQFRSDPIYHSGEIAIEGGLHGIANAERTWLQDTPTAPGMQYQTIPKEYRLARSASAAKKRLNSGKNRSAGRRRSLPDLLAGRYDTTPLAEHLANEEDNDDDNNNLGSSNTNGTLGIGADEEAEIEKAVSGIARRDRRLYQSSLAVAGPLTDVTGTHHDRMIFSLGARSPVAVAMAATPLVKFDTRKLALVRKHIREQLPAKTTAAVAALKHRLAPKDGDKDGRLTDSELMSALTDMMPNLHAEEVGLVIRYMRQRNAKRTAAAREDAISKSNTPPKEVSFSKHGLVHQHTHIAGPDEVAQMSVSTAGFGEGIDMTELADWITKQPGGTTELPNPIYAGGSHTITTFSTSPPSARELSQLSDATSSPHSHKRIVSHQYHDSPYETHEHVREAFDSTAAAETIFDRNAPFMDPRTEHHPVDYDHDVGSLLSAHTLLSSRSKGKGRPGYSEYHVLRKQASSDYARGDGNAPAAGLLSGDKKKKHGSPNSTKASKGDNDGTNSKEELTALERKERFDNFRTTWENKHGNAARKEMKNDLMEPTEGPTWTRATPTPFKVLRLAIGSPLPGSNTGSQ